LVAPNVHSQCMNRTMPHAHIAYSTKS